MKQSKHPRFKSRSYGGEDIGTMPPSPRIVGIPLNITWCHNPEDLGLNFHHTENLKSLTSEITIPTAKMNYTVNCKSKMSLCLTKYHETKSSTQS